MITPYRQQIKLISGLMRELRGVEILTSDKSQGRDKDCIVISMVRSNELGNVGDSLMVSDNVRWLIAGRVDRRPASRLEANQCFLHSRKEEARHLRLKKHAGEGPTSR